MMYDSPGLQTTTITNNSGSTAANSPESAKTFEIPTSSTSTTTIKTFDEYLFSSEFQRRIQQREAGIEMSNLLQPEALDGRMLFAIPKKGRLYEKCLELLQGADIQFKRAHRLDVALVQNHPIALVFLPAADIPRFVGEGNVDLGITGQDMVAEAGSTVSNLVTEELQLGFGKCKLQVQVPENNSSIKTVEDLVGKKVATSFDYLAGNYFAELESKQKSSNQNGTTLSNGDKQKYDGDRSQLQTKIEYVGGSVEAACALGLADGIVDLVESGETMRACGLHAIGTLLSSQAVLIRPTTPHKRSDTTLIKLITSRLRGVIAASRYVLVTYNVENEQLEENLKITPGRRAATVMPLNDKKWNAVQSMVLRNEVATVCDRLEKAGAQDILVMQLANCRIEGSS